jgi:hypothetical protein
MSNKPLFGSSNCESLDNTPTHDLSKYTVIDHLDEDVPIKGQEYCLFSFLSPEGVMNCDVRALKFRGAYPTMADAEKAVKRLEKKDKYFKIFIGETGKWLDFDPPVSRVEREMSTNEKEQELLDAQRQHRMNKINDLAGKYKETVNKQTTCKDERIKEIQKAGASADVNTGVSTVEPEPEKKKVVRHNETAKERLQRRLAEKRQTTKTTDNTEMSEVSDNIEKIRELMGSRQ